jgi:hypothetical protein
MLIITQISTRGGEGVSPYGFILRRSVTKKRRPGNAKDLGNDKDAWVRIASSVQSRQEAH